MNYFVLWFDFCDEFSRNNIYFVLFLIIFYFKIMLYILKYFYFYLYYNVNSFNFYFKLFCKRFYYIYLLIELVYIKCKRKIDDFFYDNIVVYFDVYFILLILKKM